MTNDRRTAPACRPRWGADLHAVHAGYGTTRSHLLALYQAAIPMAPDIDFVLLTADPQRLRDSHAAFALPNVRCVALSQRPAAWRLGWQLPHLQRSLGLDVLHVQHQLPWWRSGPVALSVHNCRSLAVPRRLPLGALAHGRRDAHGADVLLALSAHTAANLKRRAARVRVEPLVIGPAVDLRRFTPGPYGGVFVRARGLVPGAYVCTLGRLEPRKNLMTLLRAQALMPKPRLPLVVIGTGASARDEREAHAQVHALGLADDVVFLDSVDDLELPALLRHAAVFVYPSWEEGVALPVAEAMASGVAVVTTASSAMSEWAEGVALMAAADDPVELAAAILTLLADPRRRQILTDHGRHRMTRLGAEPAAMLMVTAVRRFLAEQRTGDAPLPATAPAEAAAPGSAAPNTGPDGLPVPGHPAPVAPRSVVDRRGNLFPPSLDRRRQRR